MTHAMPCGNRGLPEGGGKGGGGGRRETVGLGPPPASGGPVGSLYSWREDGPRATPLR